MAFKKKALKQHLKSTLIAALIGFPTVLFFCSNCRSNYGLMVQVGLFMSLIWVLMWKGNEFISIWLDRKINWMNEPGKRLSAGLVGHFIYPFVVMIAINYIVYLLFGWNKDIITVRGMINYSIPAVLITFFISTFLTAREFFFAWRQSAINEEKMKAEVIASKYETLKNQVNPHFLFNSLNVLTSLVYKDPDLSAKFIKELSKVYRYVLEVKDKELIDLKTEVEFLKSFSYLLKMRHSEGLKITIDLPESSEFKIAPLALQMLVENAVKHNVISSQEPLTIDIFLERNYLVVLNNLQRKDTREGTSSNVGLSNIKARYEFLTQHPVRVNESDSKFKVMLPLLSVDS